MVIFLARPAPPMAHRRLLLALTVGLIARCVVGGGIGLEESRAADLEAGGDVDIIASLEINEFRGQRSLQLMVEDIRSTLEKS